MAQIIWTPRILADLRRIQDYYEAIDRALAIDVLSQIARAPERLATSPLSAPTIHGTRLRKLSVRNLPYVIFHRVQGAEVYLLRVRHTSENWFPR